MLDCRKPMRDIGRASKQTAKRRVKRTVRTLRMSELNGVTARYLRELDINMGIDRAQCARAVGQYRAARMRLCADHIFEAVKDEPGLTRLEMHLEPDSVCRQLVSEEKLSSAYEEFALASSGDTPAAPPATPYRAVEKRAAKDTHPHNAPWRRRSRVAQ